MTELNNPFGTESAFSDYRRCTVAVRVYTRTSARAQAKTPIGKVFDDVATLPLTLRRRVATVPTLLGA